MRGSAVPSARPGVRVAEVDGEAVVLDEPAGLLHRCNAAASSVLRRCDGTRTVDALVAELATSREEDVVGDVHAALAQLVAAGVVTLDGGNARDGGPVGQDATWL